MDRRPIPSNLSRRDVLKGAAVAGGLFVGGSALLSGCSTSAATASGGRSNTNGNYGFVNDKAPKTGGILKIGTSGGVPTTKVEPQAGVIDDIDNVILGAAFQQLVYANDNLTVTPLLAESLEPEDVTGARWVARLRQGVEFHNGKTMTADDIVYSWRQLLNPNSGSTEAPMYSAWITPDNVIKRDTYTVEFRLTKPNFFFDYLVGEGLDAPMIPEGFDPYHPAGTGAYKWGSVSAGGTQVQMTRFENYWGKAPYPDGLLITPIADQTARVNALLSGQVNVIRNVDPDQVASINSSTGARALVCRSDSWVGAAMRVDLPPLNDVRVRQALRLAVDRAGTVDAAVDGYGFTASDLYSRFDPAYDTSLVRHRDIAQAKFLLKQAGQEGLTLQLTTAAVASGAVESAQIIASSVAAAGITVNLRQVDPSVLYGAQYTKWPFATAGWPGFSWITTTFQSQIPGAFYNETHADDPEFLSLLSQACAQPDKAKRIELLHECQQIQFDRGGYLIPSFTDNFAAATNDVQGITPDVTDQNLVSIDVPNYYFV